MNRPRREGESVRLGAKDLSEGMLCTCMYLLQALQVKQLSW